MRIERTIARLVFAGLLALLASALLPAASFAHGHGHQHGHHASVVETTDPAIEVETGGRAGSVATTGARAQTPDLNRPTRQSKMLSGMHRHCFDCPIEPPLVRVVLPRQEAIDLSAAAGGALMAFLPVPVFDAAARAPGTLAAKPPWLGSISTPPRHVLITTARLRI